MSEGYSALISPLVTPQLTVQHFFSATGEALELELIAGEAGLSHIIEEAVFHRPGLALTGFYEFFANRRIQVFGRAEITYLRELESTQRAFRWEQILQHKVPCIVLCVKQGEPVGGDILELADKYAVPLFQTPQRTIQLIQKGSLMLHELVAPRAVMHGSLVDIGGVGVLLEGPPGIGKSETALGLVRHGHALIADDTTILTVNAHGGLTGTAPDATKEFIEIRGLGFLHIATLYGIAAVKNSCSLDLIVSLRQCNNDNEVDRTGADIKYWKILGVEIQQLVVPVAAGRDFVNVVETAAAAYKMRHSGIDAAALLDKQILAHNKTMEVNHDRSN